MPKIYNRTLKGQTFPTSKFKFSADTPSGKNAVRFFQYWKNLDPELAQLASVKIYRLWPVIDLMLVEPDRKHVAVDIIDGPMPFDRPEDYQQWFIDRYKSGEWKCVLNEAQVDGAIAEAVFSAIDPDILPEVDLRTVVWGNVKNRDFRRQLEARNVRIPGDNPEQEKADKQQQEQEQMENSAVSALADQNRQLMEQNKELTDKVMDHKQPTATPEPSGDQFAMRSTIGLVVDVSKELVKQSGQGLNPAQMMDSTCTMIEKVTNLTKQDNLTPMMEMMRMSMDSQNKILEQSQAALQRQHELELARINAAAKAPETAVAKIEKSFIEQLREYKEIGELLGVGGKRRSHDDDDEPKKPGWLELLLQNGPQIVGPLTPILLGLATRFGLMPNPPAAPPQTAVQQQPGPPQPPNPLQQLANQIAANLPPELHQYVPLIMALEKPFAAKFTLQPGPDGYGLAEFVRCEGLGGDETPKGRADYMMIKEQLGPKFDGEGPDRKLVGWPFMLLVRAHPNLWAMVQSVPRPLETFMTEFFTYDEMIQKEQEDGQKVQ